MIDLNNGADQHVLVEWIETLIHRISGQYQVEITRRGDPAGATRTIIRINRRQA